MFFWFAIILCSQTFHGGNGDFIFHDAENFLQQLNGEFVLRMYGDHLPIDIETHLSKRIKRWIESRQQTSFYHQPIYPNAYHQLSNSVSDIFVFDRLSLIDLTISNAGKVHLFQHRSVSATTQLYAICHMSNEGERRLAKLALLKLSGKEKLGWSLISEQKIQNVVKIITQKVKLGTLIIILQFHDTTGLNKCSPIYLLDDNEHIKKIQCLDITYIVDTSLWHYEGDTYLGVSYSSAAYKDEKQGNGSNLIYKWRGSYFDLVQVIDTENPNKIKLFQVKGSFFLVIGNKEIKNELQNIHSDVYKLNHASEKFEIFQRILTGPVVDVHFFSVGNRGNENFFIALTVPIDEDNKHVGFEIAKTSSMIFKLKKKFSYYQTIQLHGFLGLSSLKGSNGELVLIFSTINSLKVYQYNGWKFLMLVEPLRSNGTVQLTKIFTFSGHPVVAISNLKEIKTEFYKPIFKNSSIMHSYSRNILRLSENLIQDGSVIGNFSADFSAKSEFNAEKDSIDVLDMSIINQIHTKKLLLNGNLIYDESISKQVNQLNKAMEAQVAAINILNDSCNEMLTITGLEDVKDIQIDTLILEMDNNQLRQLEVDILNNENFSDFYQDTAIGRSDDITQSVLIENLEVDDIKFAFINEKKASDFERGLLNLFKLKGLSVDGDIVLSKGLFVDGHINGVNISEDTVLLKDGDQDISGILNVSKLTVNVLESADVNDVTYKEFSDNVQSANWTTSASILLEELITENLIVHSKFGTNTFDSLYQHSLRISGKQEITAPFTINNLITKSFLVHDPMNVYFHPNNVITINDPNPMNFDGELVFNKADIGKLTVTRRFNNVQVIENRLGWLNLNASDVQNFNSEIICENLELMGPFNLQGQIKNSILKKKNPLRMITKPLDLVGDYSIDGKVTIERLLIAGDIIGLKDNISISNLLSRSIPLSRGKVDTPIIFLEPISVKNLNFTKVNKHSGNKWLVGEPGEKASVSGLKMFRSLTILDNCEGPDDVNGVNLDEFDRKLLRTDEDQEIAGNLTFKDVSINVIRAKRALIGDVDINKLMTYTSDQNIPFTMTFEKNLMVYDSLWVKNLIVKGKTSDIFLMDMLKDTVYRDQKRYVFKSRKLFTKPLMIGTLETKSNLIGPGYENLYVNMNWDKQVLIRNPIEVNNKVYCKRIVVDNYIDEMKAEHFGKNWLLKEGNQQIIKKQIIKNVAVLNSVDVTSGLINEMHLNDFSKVLTVDSDLEIKNMEVSEIIVPAIYLYDKFNNYKLSDILLTDGEHQTVKQPYNFKGDIQVDGNVNFEKLFGTEIQLLMDFMYPVDNCDVKLFIKVKYVSQKIPGNAIFSNEPTINKVYGLDVKEIMNNIWYADDDIVIKNKLHLNELILENGVELKGLINNVSLKEIENNYVSKTLDQEIYGNINVEQIDATSVFVKDLSTSNVQVKYLNSTLEDFYSNVLYTVGEQVINGIIVFENLEATDVIEIKGTVNGLNFENDVMKFDGSGNIMVAGKEFNNIFADNLILQPGIKVNDIDIISWFDSAVLKNKQFQSIVGKKHIHLCKANEIRLQKLNDLNIPNDLVLRDKPQHITGLKVFSPTTDQLTIVFQDLNVKSILNKFPVQNIEYLLNPSGKVNMAPGKIFKNEMFASNIHINEGQHEVYNIIEYLKSDDNYSLVHKYFATLRTCSADLWANSIKSNKLERFEYVQAIVSNTAINPDRLPLCFYDNNMITIVKYLDETSSLINFYKWSNEKTTFTLDEDLRQLETPAIKNVWWLYDFHFVISTNSYGTYYARPVGNDFKFERLWNGSIRTVCHFTKNGITYIIVLASDGLFITRDEKIEWSVLKINRELSNAADIYIHSSNDKVFLVMVSNNLDGTVSVSVLNWNIHMEEFQPVDTINFHVKIKILKDYIFTFYEDFIDIYRLEASGAMMKWDTIRLVNSMDANIILTNDNGNIFDFANVENGIRYISLYHYKGLYGFEKITKLPLLNYVISSRSFMINHEYFISMVCADKIEIYKLS